MGAILFEFRNETTIAGEYTLEFEFELGLPVSHPAHVLVPTRKGVLGAQSPTRVDPRPQGRSESITSSRGEGPSPSPVRGTGDGLDSTESSESSTYLGP